MGVGLALQVSTVPVARAASFEPDEPSSATVVVAPLQVEGTLSEQEIEKVQQELLAGLQRAGLSIVAPGEVDPGEAELPCGESAECIAELARANEATHVLQVQIVQSGRDYELQMLLSNGMDGATQAKSVQQCEICGLKELGELIGDQGASLQPKLEAVPATLVVETNPPGAAVRVDGRLIGVTPIAEPIPEGEHTIVIAKPGYVERERTITAVSGGEETISLGLQKVPEPVVLEEQPDGRGMRIAGWTALGVGLGLVGAGASMLALDERPVESRCSGQNIDINGLCRYRYNTLAGGAALFAAGGAALITAAVLVSVGYKRKKKKGGGDESARVLPTVLPNGTGVLVRF